MPPGNCRLRGAGPWPRRPPARATRSRPRG
jgi:hypothetical protein